MIALEVPLERLPHAAGLDLPAYATAGAAGCDLRAAIPAEGPISLTPLGRVLVPTGLRIALPPGLEAQVRPRSGLALRHGVTVLNTPGTIDSDFRGEIGVILINLSHELYTVHRGDRVAQLVIASVARVAWVERLIDVGGTDRGVGGFGSTG